jgi:flagellar basal-body rod modification protein FlgD
LQLLTTQLKNQDPLSPLDTNQFTQQLVAFASVEQQLKTNTDLDQIITQNKTSQATAALSFVGKQVTADGSTTQLKKGVAVWNVTSPKPAAISILDQNGNTVWTGQQTLNTGAQAFSWNGNTSNGTIAPTVFIRCRSRRRTRQRSPSASPCKSPARSPASISAARSPCCRWVRAI